MLEVWIVVSIVLAGILLFGFAAYTVMWLIERSEYGIDDKDAQRYARMAIACLAGSALSWTWLLTAPLALMYLIYRITKEAFPSGLHKNELN
jgi:hypothetical protein